ncbi:MAG: hypothetical protein ACI8TP_003138 [Acidimicrobiales bacterium]|jgi:hypothetical protein
MVQTVTATCVVRKPILAQFWIPLTSGILSLQGLVVFFSGFAHLVRTQLSQRPIERGDVILAFCLAVAGVVLVRTSRIAEGLKDTRPTGIDRPTLALTALFEIVTAGWFLWNVFSHPTNGVSDFILVMVALTGVVASGTLGLVSNLISVRA